MTRPVVVPGSEEWPEPSFLETALPGGQTYADLWFARLAELPGSGVWAGDDPAAGWASPAVRVRYDTAQWRQSGHRCPSCLTALPPGHGRYCGRRCRGYRRRPGSLSRAAWVRCAVDGVPLMVAVPGGPRPHHVCPPPPGEAGPSSCESAWTRVLARDRQRRRRCRLAAVPQGPRPPRLAGLDELMDALSEPAPL